MTRQSEIVARAVTVRLPKSRSLEFMFGPTAYSPLNKSSLIKDVQVGGESG